MRPTAWDCADAELSNVWLHQGSIVSRSVCHDCIELPGKHPLSSIATVCRKPIKQFKSIFHLPENLSDADQFDDVVRSVLRGSTDWIPQIESMPLNQLTPRRNQLAERGGCRT